ncbi:GntR family transcriptional regulator [Streptomyces albireticuli]|uniref:GntR family transcriptional regulator n=1 Tax=Streptomyces albireticuli TaxID=1940 RepID=A0A2A2D160_9ACTN|nr:GntR family transcriptional regulator [Streptomyces albireticuli]MCD9141350.1 GntR family transcriptional regulator [Streptomyces albireticuli]MCD9160689.1 GntR family transcriptional regulator [Streptomyces albireticuli]MCD9195755.1 GntR family transcriptional regulator [Streptomyces albireticuli]PAU45251.1 GntR family transcriptional regulator [Streptomyces albireticuli]
MNGEASHNNAESTGNLTRVPLSEQVRRIMLDNLVRGRWQAGQRIVERRLAMELGVSQAPVREALRDLQAMRLVESSPHRGTRVGDLSPRRLCQVYPVRGALERLAAELALPRLAGDVSRLEEHTEGMRRAAAAEDVDAQVRHGVAFHREVVRAAGNAVLSTNWETLAVELWTHLSLTRVRTGLHENARDHEPIIEAFRRRDPDVGRLLQLHILGYAHESIGAS